MANDFFVPSESRGRRSIPSAVDEIAEKAPERIFACIPIDNHDLSKGFKEVSFGRFANAINHACSWLDAQLGSAGDPAEPPTFSYEGIKDLRVPILTVAAVKTRRKLLILTALASMEGRANLLDATGCLHMLHDDAFAKIVADTVTLRPNVETRRVPDLAAWLTDLPAAPYAYSRPWDLAWNDPILVFHTSGTTGHPKPINWTNAMMNFYDSSVNLPRGDDNLTARISRGRYYTTTGAGSGTASLLTHAVWRGATNVFGPSHQSPHVETAIETILSGQVTAVLTTPSFIQQMETRPRGLQALQRLEVLTWTGAPLGRIVGDRLREQGVHLAPCYGSTECAGLNTHIPPDPKDWYCYEFQAGQGIDFLEQPESGFFEMIIDRETAVGQRPQGVSGHTQAAFVTFPDQKRWHSSDLFKPHPDRNKTGLWIYQGRKDELVKLNNGVGLLPTLFEPLIAEHSQVRGVLIGGESRNAPFVLIQPTSHQDLDHEALLGEIWNIIETQINQAFLGNALRFQRSKLIISDSERPFIRTWKDSISRAAVFKLYKPEIDALYHEESKATP